MKQQRVGVGREVAVKRVIKMFAILIPPLIKLARSTLAVFDQGVLNPVTIGVLQCKFQI